MAKSQPVWPKRFPRKPKARAIAKKELKQASKRLAAKPSKLVVGCPQPLPKSGKHVARRRAANAPAVGQLTERAKRLQEGRTVTVALMLARFHVFQPLQQDSPLDTLPPTRGLNAIYNGTDVFIVDLFTRWGSCLADVAPLSETGSGTWRLGKVQTVQRGQLTGVGLRCKVKALRRGVVHLERVQDMNAPDVPRCFKETEALAFRLLQANTIQWPSMESGQQPHSVVPLGASLHGKLLGHEVRPRCDKGGIRLVLDLPLPRLVDGRPWRCSTCRSAAGTESGNYFAVADEDYLDQLGDVCLLWVEKHGLLLVTPLFLLWLLQSFYDA